MVVFVMVVVIVVVMVEIITANLCEFWMRSTCAQAGDQPRIITRS